MALFLCSITILFCAVLLFFYRWRSLKHAQKLLRVAKQEARDIAELSLGNPHPVLQITEDTNILYTNLSALDTFPTLKEEGRTHIILQGLEDHVNASHEVMREVCVQNKIYHQIIRPGQLKDRMSYIIYLSDITGLKDKEKALSDANSQAQELRQQAEQANKARGDFLANMSHELRTPMNGIIGLSEILSEGGLPDEKQEMAQAVHSSAKGLLILLNDILDFSKIEAGQLTIEHIAFDLSHVLEQMKGLHAPVAESKGLDFKINMSGDVPTHIMSDPMRLQQILNNLVNNAIKFTEQGRVHITVSAMNKTEEDVDIRISVEDSGIGIPKEKQAQIFEKFQQAEGATSRKYGGTGLGLAITRHLVGIMEGQLSIESEEGHGTTFTVLLPCKIGADLKDDIAQQKQEGVSVHTKASLPSKTSILIVDDHPVNLLFMRQTLKKIGFENFEEAQSGAEAVKMSQNKSYQLILMDCHMPDMDGFTATKQIREFNMPQDKPVIIAVTADAMEGAAQKCHAAGMDDYISKPVDRQALASLLKKWLPAEVDVSDTDQQSVPDSASKHVIDWHHFEEFTEGDAEMERELLKIFIENLQQDLTTLHQCYTKQDFAGWEEAAHKLYGASSHVGAYALADICGQAEGLDLSDIPPIKDMHLAILQESRRVKEALLARA